MNDKLTATQIIKLYDELLAEVYYGFNMKCIMSDLPAEELDVIRRFVIKCRGSR